MCIFGKAFVFLAFLALFWVKNMICEGCVIVGKECVSSAMHAHDWQRMCSLAKDRGEWQRMCSLAKNVFFGKEANEPYK